MTNQPTDRPTYKALAKPLRILRGASKPIMASALLLGAAAAAVSIAIGVQDLLVIVIALGTGGAIYAAGREALRRDPAFFQILRRAYQVELLTVWPLRSQFRQRPRYDAAKRQPVEVRIV